MNKILLAAVLGGVAFFAWGWVSHGVLPFHHHALLGFTDEAAVTNAIQANAPQSGTYFLPWIPPRAGGMSQEAYGAAKKKAEEQMMNGPFMLASIRLGPIGSYPMLFVTQLITGILTALFMALILARTAQSSFKNQVMSALWIGLAGSCALTLPQWNWYGFSIAFTLAQLFDTVVGFLLVGMLITRILRGKTPSGSQPA